MTDYPTIPPLQPFQDFDPSTGHGVPDHTDVNAVKVTAPAHNATIAGSSVTVTATVVDDSDATVDFYLDGVLIHTDASSPWTFTYDASALKNGNHYLSATSVSASKATNWSPLVTLTVANTPKWARFDHVFGPSGCATVADLSALQALTTCKADPQTAWKAGQNVTLADASLAYWTGAAWALDNR